MNYLDVHPYRQFRWQQQEVAKRVRSAPEKSEEAGVHTMQSMCYVASEEEHGMYIPTCLP